MDAGSQKHESQDALSQTDVENLVAAASTVEPGVTVFKAGKVAKQQSKESIQPFDVRHPATLSPSQLRKLRIKHEDFIRALSAKLSIYLRMEFNLAIVKFQTQPFQKFAESLGNPTHLTLFKIDPLRGIAVLDIHPRLGLTMVDRLMGGSAQGIKGDQELREIEVALVDEIVQLVLNEWCLHWASVRELRPTILGHESNGRFLQTSAHDTIMLSLTVEARLGDCLQTMQLAFPHSILEPLIAQLGQSMESSDPDADKPASTPIAWNHELDDIEIPIIAEWNGLEMTARVLSQLKPGDVLQMSPNCAANVEVRLNGISKFVGRLGTANEKWAVEITQIIRNQT